MPEINLQGQDFSWNLEEQDVLCDDAICPVHDKEDEDEDTRRMSAP